MSVRHYAALPSTSTEAMRLALDGALAGDGGRLWVVADDQTAGRGRSGRAWQSIAGNLYASCLVRLACPAAVAQQLSLVAGVAVVDALRGVADGAGVAMRVPFILKWPNDVMIEGAKTGGILVETSGGAGAPGLAAVIGVGLNITGHPDGLGRAATHLQAHGLAITAEAMLVALDRALGDWLAIWAEGSGLDLIRAAWLERGLPIGTELSVNTGSGPVTGRFAGLSSGGALLLDQAGAGIVEYHWGDVAMAPAAAGKVE